MLAIYLVFAEDRNEGRNHRIAELCNIIVQF